MPLHWVPLENCYEFWKTEVRTHLAALDCGASLEDFSKGYCYFASEWKSEAASGPVVVLEKHH